MKRYKLTNEDTLGQALDGDEIEAGVESRPFIAFWLYAPDGKLVGVELPDVEKHQVREGTPSAVRQSHPASEGRPFDPKRFQCPFPIEQDDGLEDTIEAWRQSEVWTNPWD